MAAVRSARGWLLVVLAAAAAAWFGSTELAWPARAFLTFLVAILPLLTLAQLPLADDVAGRVPRPALYASSAFGIWLLGLLAAAAGWASGFTPRIFGFFLPPWPELLGWSLGTTAAGVGLMFAAHAAGVRESELLRYLLPRTRRERVGFVGLSLSAGIGEELAFRSFLIPALTVASGSVALAVVLSSVVFGLVHSYQHTSGVVRAALLGGMLAAPFVVTGSVLPSMIAHTLLDVIGGIWLGERLARR